MTPHIYNPKILNHDAMQSETEQALRVFMNSDRRKPTIAARLFFQDGERDMSLSRIIEVYDSCWGVATMPEWKELGFQEEALSRALFKIQTDPLIEDLLVTLFWKTSESFLMDKGFIEMFIMPGVIRLAYPVPSSLGEDYATLVGLNEMEDHDPRLKNLGVFCAGQWTTGHEAMEIARKVQSVKPVWKGFHDDFNKDMEKKFYKISLGDPTPTQGKASA